MRVSHINCARDCSDRPRFVIHTAEIGRSGVIVGIGHEVVHSVANVDRWFRALNKTQTRPGLYEHAAITSTDAVLAKQVAALLLEREVIVMDAHVHRKMLEDVRTFAEVEGRFGVNCNHSSGWCSHKR